MPACLRIGPPSLPTCVSPIVVYSTCPCSHPTFQDRSPSGRQRTRLPRLPVALLASVFLTAPSACWYANSSSLPDCVPARPVYASGHPVCLSPLFTGTSARRLSHSSHLRPLRSFPSCHLRLPVSSVRPPSLLVYSLCVSPMYWLVHV